MFHVREGLYFKRLPDGSVRIEKRADGRSDSPTLFEITIDDWSWASVVASVSLQGEAGERFFQAKDFHNGQPPATRALGAVDVVVDGKKLDVVVVTTEGDRLQ